MTLFGKFTRELQRPSLWPLPIREIVLFMAYMSKRGYAYRTVRTYITAIGYFHKIENVPDPTINVVVHKMLLGYRRDVGVNRDLRQPITLDILERILPALTHVCHSIYEAVLFRAVFSLAFFGFMRVGEITADSRSAPRASVLHITDLFVRSVNGKSELQVFIRKSKTNQYGPHRS